jgi:hypothetical protein
MQARITGVAGLLVVALVAVSAGLASTSPLGAAVNSTATEEVQHTTNPPPGVAVEKPYGLAVAPDGDLYVVDTGRDQVLRFTSGRIQVFTAPDQLAFDGTGDLYVPGNNGLGLFEKSAHGHLSYLGQFRGDGDAGALAEAPNGTVVESWRDGLTRRSESGRTEPVTGDVDRALGPNRHLVGGYNIFIGSDGVAVGPDGTVYADTDLGNTFTAVSALLAVNPTGTVSALWKS